jgi:hypothetical protein
VAPLVFEQTVAPLVTRSYTFSKKKSQLLAVDRSSPALLSEQERRRQKVAPLVFEQTAAPLVTRSYTFSKKNHSYLLLIDHHLLCDQNKKGDAKNNEQKQPVQMLALSTVANSRT